MPPKSKKVEDKNQSEKKNAKKLKDELDEIDRELEKINAEEEKKEEKKAEKTAMKTGEFEINNQTIEIFNNLMNYYNSTNSIKCSIEDEKKSERIRRYYKSISTDEKQKNYLLKRNKLLFYKNKDTEILPKINLYAALKSEEQDDIIEKLWDNLILLYLSCEENSKNKDDTMFENLNKAMEDGSLGKMFENLNEEVKKMDISQMFEKLKFNTNPEAKAKTTNMLSDMISKLTDNMVEISKSENPQDALMSNLHNMAADYSKLFESGEVDFMSFLSAVPEILSNPKELTKNIDLTKLEGIKLPDLNSIINSTQNVGEDALKGSTDGKKAAEAFSKMFGGGANPMGDILKGMMSGGKDGTNPMADIMKGMMSGGKDGANPMADIMKNMMSGSGANGGANPMMDMMKNMISGASSGGDGANPMADIMKNMMSGASANGGANPMMDMVKNMMTGGGGGGGGGGGLGALGALGALGGLGGEGGITNSLNKMTGGALDNVLASVIENQGSSMLEKMAADAEESKNKKPLTPDQIKELEEYLANQKIN